MKKQENNNTGVSNMVTWRNGIIYGAIMAQYMVTWRNGAINHKVPQIFS